MSKFAGLLAVLVLLGWLFFQSNKVDVEQHVRTIERFRLLKELDATLNQYVLQARFGILENYDTILTVQQQMRLLLLDLEQDTAQYFVAVEAPANAAFLRYLAVLHGKNLLIERFKSQNAVLKNSLRYFPIAVRTLQDSGHGSMQLGSLLHALREDVLLYSHAQEGQPGKEAIETELSRLVRLGRGDALQNLGKHVVVILSYKSSVDEQLRQISLIPTSVRNDELFDLYNQQFIHELDRAARYKQLLVLLALALAGYVAWAVARLNKTRNELATEHHFALVQTQQLQESESRLSTIFNSALDAIIGIDAQGRITDWNARAQTLFGWSRDEVLGLTLDATIIPAQHLESHRHGLARFLATGEERILNRRMVSTALRRNRTEFPIEMAIIFRKTGDTCHFTAFIADITERQQAEESLRLAASVFTHAREGIMITAADGTIIDVNDAFTRITGYHRDEVTGRNPRILSSGRQGKEFYVALWRDLIEKGNWYGELWNRRKSGEVYAEMQTISAVRDAQGSVRQYVALFSDITALKEHQSQLEHTAHYDALTQLPNRLLLADRLHQAIAQTQRRGQLLAVTFLDLDGFKAINDKYGHETGDQLLITLAARMKQTLREGDTLARIGGDEFVAVLVDLPDVGSSVPMLSRLLTAAAQPVHVGDLVLQVSASLGVTFFPQAEDADADLLLRQADQAMYQAKLAGKNRYHVFDAEQHRSVLGHHESVERIRSALREREFVLYYQPKVNMRSGAVIGAEALIRWQHPQKGLLPPAMFLPVIEDHALAIDIGEWVIDTALTQMELWQTGGLAMPVSVNISARQLQQADFALRLQEILAAHPNVSPADLELEVLETSALEDLAHVSQIIESCRVLGVSFALDDFGTGYSSLTYLKRLPVTFLKIDQSFVRDMLDDPDDLAILEGVIGLAGAFRRQVIAEGVETVEHGAMLLQLGCELAQGYGIARPMPAQALPAWSAAWQPNPAWVDLPAVSREDLPLLFASADHRAWVVAIAAFLQGARETQLPPDLHQCRLGRWLDVEGLARYGAQPAFQAIKPLHEELHALATELLALQASGCSPNARARLGELYDLRDALLAQLKVALRENQR